jgi:methionyl-tRNA formyltransferase
VRIVLYANNRLGWRIAEDLRSRGEEIVALVLHPPSRRRLGDEILRAAGVGPSRVLDGSRLGAPEVVEALRTSRPEIGVSAHFGYRLRRDVLALMPKGCVNVHPGFLPFNRGAYPNVWSIVDETPAGATIHYMDEDIDTGDVISQRRIAVDPADTGETLYVRLEEACLELFRETWPQIHEGRAPRRPQREDEGTRHRVRDVEAIDEIELDRSYTARNLLNILRARTFGSFPGAYFKDGNRKIYVTVQLRELASAATEEESA